MELVLEQTQQGTSYEVSVSTEGFEELKRKVKIKGEKKEALLTLSFGPKDPVFVKSLADNSEVSITGGNKPKLSEVEDSTMYNYDTGKRINLQSIAPPPLFLLEKPSGAEPVSGPKTIKSILKSRSTLKAETLKELNELKLQISKTKSSYFRNKNSQQVPPNALQNKYKTQFKMNCEMYGQNKHLSENCYEVLFCKKCKRTNHRTCDRAEFMSSMNINQYHIGQGESFSRSRPSRPAIPFPSYIHCRYNDHKSDDCVYYPICEICGIYDHDTHGHNMIISLRRGIKPRNPQHVTKNCETCGSNVHTTSDHNDIEWFRKRESLQAKRVESFKATTAHENSKVSFSISTGGIYGKVGVNTFRNAIGAHYLPHSSEYVAPPSIDIVRQWFPTIGYGEEVSAKGTLKKSLLPPKWSLANEINIDYASIFWEDIIIKLNKRHREKVVPYTRFLSLLMMHKMKEGYGDGELTLYPTQVFSISQWYLKLPNSLPMLRGFHKAQRLKLNLDTKSIQLLQNNPMCSAKRHQKVGPLKHPPILKLAIIRKEKSPARPYPNQPLVSTPVDTRIHKEDQQATSGPTSLGVTNEERANPWLSNGASFIARQVEEEEAFNTIKLEDLSKLVLNVKPSFKDLDSPKDDPFIVVDDSNEDEEDEIYTTTNDETEDTSSQKHKLELEKNKAEAESALLKAQPSFPNVGQLNELLVKSLQTEFSKILFAHDFISLLPTKLKDLPSKFNELTEKVKGLKKQVHELEIELPGDLKKFPPIQVAVVQAKLKTLDDLSCLLLNVTKALNKFAQVLDSTSSRVGDQSVPSAGQADTMPAEGEKNTNQETIS
uniref:Uncharacterized protein n=1 Tax=Tanacetum cinerariifolium TaxID=118510 RepID=A0A6L2JKU8_TANCI|nr:hypothetical protein [Tanacetum cinerariifolium]